MLVGHELLIVECETPDIYCLGSALSCAMHGKRSNAHA